MDARRKGSDGRRETFAKQKEAEDRAATIAAEYAGQGSETLAMPIELRAAAIQGERILAPYDKTILQACEFYRDHLQGERKRKASETIETLADAWYADKTSGNEKDLRSETVRGIRYGRDSLKTVFAGKRVLEVSTADIRQHLDGLTVGKRRKVNINSRWSQFFNWAIKKGYATENPCDEIDIEPGRAKIATFKPEEAQRLMEICETTCPKLTLFFALALFAGLRPDDNSEAQNLTWEDIDLTERSIFIHAHKSKVKEDRPVPIEDNLYHWLVTYRPKNARGLVTEGTNFHKRRQAVHIAMGYRAQGHNAAAVTWPQDITRHSYCSYGLAMGLTKGQVAERSGNSPKMIKAHYKRVLPRSKAVAYWSILPGGVSQKIADEEDEITRQVFAGN